MLDNLAALCEATIDELCEVAWEHDITISRETMLANCMRKCRNPDGSRRFPEVK